MRKSITRIATVTGMAASIYTIGALVPHHDDVSNRTAPQTSIDKNKVVSAALTPDQQRLQSEINQRVQNLGHAIVGRGIKTNQFISHTKNLAGNPYVTVVPGTGILDNSEHQYSSTVTRTNKNNTELITDYASVVTSASGNIRLIDDVHHESTLKSDATGIGGTVLGADGIPETSSDRSVHLNAQVNASDQWSVYGYSNPNALDKEAAIDKALSDLQTYLAPLEPATGISN